MSLVELIIIVLLAINILLICVLISKVSKNNKQDIQKVVTNKTAIKKVKPKDQTSKVINPPKDNEHKESKLDYINPGDIVYCVMPLSKEKLEKVPKGHRIRPYLIVDKSNTFLYGYYSTTHISEKVPYQQKYTYIRDLVNKEGEIVDSNFLFNIAVKIPEKNILYTLDSLDDYEKEEVERRLIIKKLRGFPDVDRNSLKLKVGDIIINESKWYFISDIDKTGIYGYKAYPGNHGSRVGTRVSRQYGPIYYNFKEKVKLENVTAKDLLYISSPSETSNVLKAADDFKRNIKYQKKKENQRKAKAEKKKIAQEINKKYNPNQQNKIKEEATDEQQAYWDEVLDDIHAKIE